MRLIANENISGTVIRLLRANGHDVLAVKESKRGAADETVLARAQDDDRVVLTHDKDFGELAFQRRLPASSGVVLLRLADSDSESENRRILEVMNSQLDWRGSFTVVTADYVRMRALPDAGEGISGRGANAS